jgi:pimeloyl-ACP methyl ester carboxylesterase
LVGIGPAGLVALTAAGLFPDRVSAVAVIESPLSLVTDKPYPAGTRMGLLAPGMLRVGDIPQLAALAAPRSLVVADGRTSQGGRLTREQLQEALGFTANIYRLHKQEARLRLLEEFLPDAVVEGLAGERGT